MYFTKRKIYRIVVYITLIFILFQLRFLFWDTVSSLELTDSIDHIRNKLKNVESDLDILFIQNHDEFGQQETTDPQSEPLNKGFSVKLDTKEELTPISSSIYNLSPLQLMKVPKIEFIKGLKNPCFYVKNPPQNDGGVWVEDDVVLKCWPYYQLIGVEKCGTTDLYNRLMVHHHLLPMRFGSGKDVKEPLWYNGIFQKELHNHTVGGYLSLMNNATHTIKKLCHDRVINTNIIQLLDLSESNITSNMAQQVILGYLSLMNNATHTISKLCPDRVINNNAAGKDFCPYLIGDFSARTINHNILWHLEEENQNLTIPKVLVSDKIHHINPDTKIIIMLRNPIARLFSDYMFYTRDGSLGFNASQQDFHTRVVEAIAVWEMCVSRYKLNEDTCANGRRWADLRGVKIGAFWSHHSCGRLAVSIYSIYVNDWLRVFPRRNIHVIQLEAYSRKPLEYIEKHILPFLGLEPFTAETRSYLVTEEKGNVQHNKSWESDRRMWNQTWRLLEDFFEPYNRQLVDMLGDEKFLWR